jgi:hypothetical protein
MREFVSNGLRPDHPVSFLNRSESSYSGDETFQELLENRVGSEFNP